VLLLVAGLVNAVLGAQMGAWVYEVYPGGKMGHVGILAGVVAVIIGVFIVFAVVPLYEKRNRWLLALGGLLTMVLGHAGAIAGAVYVGTVGVVLCYVAGRLWALIAAAYGRSTAGSSA
jgi:hypothetical protein